MGEGIKRNSNKLLRADSHEETRLAKLMWMDTIIEQIESVSGSSSSHSTQTAPETR